MESVNVERKDIADIVESSFPDYNGRKFCIVVAERVSFHDVFWGGGSRNEYCAVELGSNLARQADIGRYAGQNIEGTAIDIPIGVAIVEHTIFQGRDMGLRIHVRPENAAPLLPAANSSVSDRDRSILAIFRGIKSGPYRAEYLARAKVEQAEIDALVARGLLKRNAAGSVQITLAGKNASAGKSAY